MKKVVEKSRRRLMSMYVSAKRRASLENRSLGRLKSFSLTQELL